MMTNEKLVNEAKQSYERYFKDTLGTVSPKSEDVVLDQQKLTKEINAKKETTEKRHESLEVLREQLNHEAEKSLEKTFGEEKLAESKKKMNTDEMFEELNQEKDYLTKMVSDLKKQQIQKNKH